MLDAKNMPTKTSHCLSLRKLAKGFINTPTSTTTLCCPRDYFAQYDRHEQKASCMVPDLTDDRSYVRISSSYKVKTCLTLKYERGRPWGRVHV
jgi:hypothetical protein